MYSIVICTYNPSESILSRCLESVLKLDCNATEVEVIIVDNNSTIPLSSTKYIQNFCAAFSGSKVIVETKQGLSNARVAGIEEAKGEWVVFLDDDNEVSATYLQELKRLNRLFPHVGAWGPGKVVVDFVDGVDPLQEHYLRPIFQERQAQQVEFALTASWQPFYPFGTGLCVQRDILLQYASYIKSQKLTLSGRDAETLMSGEDTQIVFMAIKYGKAAGHSPNLQATHIIPKKRLSDAYTKKLIYGTRVCNCISLVEVFPACLTAIKQQQHRSSKFAWKVLKNYLKASLTTSHKKTLDLIDYLAYMSGSYKATGTAIPKVVKWVSRRLDVS